MSQAYRTFLLLFLILGSLQSIVAQNAQPKVREFDENNGFQSTNYISDLQIDQNGMLWVVDFNGIRTYDGRQFKSINSGSVSHSSLLRLEIDKRGEKLVVDFLGEIFILDGDSLREHKYNDKIQRLKPRNGYTDLFIDSIGRLHISYYKIGYVILDSNKIEYPFHDRLSGKRGEFCWLRNEQEPFIFTHQGANSSERQRFFYLMDERMKIIDSLPSKNNDFQNPSSWVSLNDKSDYLITNGRGDLYQIDDGKNLVRKELEQGVRDIIKGDQNGIWLSLHDGGIHAYNSSKLNRSKYHLFPNETATAGAIDQEGGVWLFSQDKGLMHIAYPQFVYYNQNNQLLYNDHVFGLEKVGDSLLVSSENSLLSVIDLERSELSLWQIPAIKGKTIYSIFNDEASKSIWLCLRGELYFKRANKEQWNSVNLSGFDQGNSGDIVRILGRSESALIGALNNQFFYIRDFDIDYISPSYPDDIFQVQPYGDSIFIGAEDGLYIQHRGEVQYLGESFNEFTERVYSINQLGKSLFFSIRNQGVFEWKEGSFDQLTYEGQALNKGAVFKIDEENLLIISREAAFRLSKQATGWDWQAFERPPKIIAGNFILRDASIFWGTWQEGVFETPLESIFADTLKKQHLKLNEFKIDGKTTELVHEMEIPYNKGLLEFNYQSISFQNWDLLYRYRLKGLSESWTETDERKVQFTTLPTGDYLFEVQVKKGDQFWSESLAYEFTVTPPFWKTWWFLISTIVFLGLSVYFLINRRIKQVRREKDLVIDRLEAEQRALRAQMDPHFVFNIVSSAQYLVHKEENEKAIHFLNKFSQLMRNILDYSNTNYISLKEELVFLKDYIELEQIRLENSFQVEWDIEDFLDLEKIYLPPFMTQPFIENAIHHGLKNKEGERKIKIGMHRNKKFLHLSIEDNGIGREQAEKYISKAKRIRKSHGLRIIKERLELHNSTINNLTIEDLYPDKKNSGTRVFLRLKIVKHEVADR